MFFPATLQVETCTICHTFFQSVPSNILDNACLVITEYYYRLLPDLFRMFLYSSDFKLPLMTMCPL